MSATAAKSISDFLENETYPQRRLRFSQSDLFARIARFIAWPTAAMGLDSIEADSDLRSPRIKELGLDFVTSAELDLFLSTIGDKSMPGTGDTKTYISEDGCVQVDAFKSHGLYIHVIEGDSVIVCVANSAGAVVPHWTETFERCGVPTAIQR